MQIESNMFIFGGIAPRTRDIKRVSNNKLVDMGDLRVGLSDSEEVMI